MHKIAEAKSHTDLQVSVERSGMDSLILKQFLYKLENLEIVQINVISFYCLDPEPVDDGLRFTQARVPRRQSYLRAIVPTGRAFSMV
ncbi:uncharacterized protein ALTATR162_LOCUS11308 [Alternaria atra]|jgi:hypothetical protein|uniref:Uncharacterized protein n=1 Tax=Alternaria atra TaxID=119953 RepID=A0A8J2ICK7_9PLEO|nr:uncharacterized protein ALTATR162_LOCUS11308 [Alternaria atra]CAG5185451.1 unnamed protein product [Alternaria atra]